MKEKNEQIINKIFKKRTGNSGTVIDDKEIYSGKRNNSCEIDNNINIYSLIIQGSDTWRM